MPYYFHKCIIGDIYFDKNLNQVHKPKQVKAIITEASGDKLNLIMKELKDKKNYSAYVRENLKQTIKDISTSGTTDTFVVQCSGTCDDIQKTLNIMHNRIREWVGYVSPELTRYVADMTVLSRMLLKNSIKEVLSKQNIKHEMTSSQPKDSEQAMQALVKCAVQADETLKKQKEQLEKLCQSIIPNITAIAGHVLAGKLLRLSGSLERMARLPASTIQMLGAEAALFRHLKTRARPPKHGILHGHPLISKVDRKDVGKVARHLANKISLAAKIDFFKGKFCGDKLKKDIEKRFEKW